MDSLRRMFAAVALALVVAPLIASAPLFDPDEGLHAAIAQEMVRRGDYVTPTFMGEPFLDKPILFFWAEAASLRTFGDNEFAVRVPPLFFGLLGMLSVALLARAVFDEATGFVAGIAYGTMLLPLGVSQVAVHDIGLVPFMCAACWCLVAGRNTLALAIAAGVMLGLSILTKGLVGCVFTCIFAACVAVRQPSAIPRLAFMLVVAGIVALLVAAPWYIAMERAHPGYLHYYFVERHLQGYLTATQRHAGRPFWYYVPIVIGGVLPWTGYLAMVRSRAGQDSRARVVLGWFAIGLVFLSIGESKLVTYALPLFPALALAIGDVVADRFVCGTRRDAPLRLAFLVHAAALALLPAAGLAVLQWKFDSNDTALWPWIAVCTAAVIYASARAWRSQGAGFVGWMAGAGVASLAAMMIVLPHAAAWMTSRDLAAALNEGGTLPSRVSVVDERIGSLVFYLAPPLRADATPDRVSFASFTDAVMRARVDPGDAIVAVRQNQIERFNRLFPRPPVPDRQAGTFTIFRALTLRETLQSP